MFRTQGIGLGLSTAQALTAAMQGAISLETCEDEGTTVTFSVLVNEEQEELP